MPQLTLGGRLLGRRLGRLFCCRWRFTFRCGCFSPGRHCGISRPTLLGQRGAGRVIWWQHFCWSLLGGRHFFGWSREGRVQVLTSVRVLPTERSVTNGKHILVTKNQGRLIAHFLGIQLSLTVISWKTSQQTLKKNRFFNSISIGRIEECLCTRTYLFILINRDPAMLSWHRRQLNAYIASLSSAQKTLGAHEWKNGSIDAGATDHHNGTVERHLLLDLGLGEVFVGGLFFFLVLPLAAQVVELTPSFKNCPQHQRTKENSSLWFHEFWEEMLVRLGGKI